jgi:hypothetical protein
MSFGFLKFVHDKNGSRDWDSKIRLFGPFLREKENPDLQGKDSNLCCQVKSIQK